MELIGTANDSRGAKVIYTAEQLVYYAKLALYSRCKWTKGHA